MTTTSTGRNPNTVAPTTQPNTEGGKKTKAQPTGQKLLIRHLPPLITEQEVQAILGEEWKTGNGRVDWAQFQQGKVSKSAFKEPRPSFYSLHLVKVEDVPIFREFVLKSTWHDSKNTYTMLTFQAHAQDVATRVPPTKHRVDPRQGTIDQDPEFQAYLHALTQPKEAQPKETESGDQLASTNDDSTKEKQVSHLVKFIQEKKAAKAKEIAAAKSAKHNRQDSQGGKSKGAEDSKKKGKDNKNDKNDRDKEKDKAKEPVPKLLTKKAAAQEAAAEAAKQTASQKSTAKASEEAAPKSRRANIAQAAKILQRDLGLSPGSAHRRARQNAAKAEAAGTSESSATTANNKEAVETAKEPEPTKTVPTGPKAQAAEGSRRSRGKAKAAASGAGASDTTKGKSTDSPSKPTTGPIILLKKDNAKKEESPATNSAAPSTSSNAQTAPSSTTNTAPPTGPKGSAGKSSSSKPGASSQQKKGGPQPNHGATRAFIKHANPSQGVTEPLLKQAMEVFGPVTFVEIDKRKGFAYVDFGDAEALRQAIAASPVSIAQGTVQVLERKDKKPVSSVPAEKPASEPTTSTTASATAERPKRGNRGRGRRGGGANANTTANNSGAQEKTTVPAAG